VPRTRRVGNSRYQTRGRPPLAGAGDLPRPGQSRQADKVEFDLEPAKNSEREFSVPFIVPPSSSFSSVNES
jgi:hypothetical protein